MFDRRRLTPDGVESLVHKFEGHSAAVLCVQVKICSYFLNLDLDSCNVHIASVLFCLLIYYYL